MITFQRQSGGLYLTEAGAANPSGARVGFLFQDAGRTDPTYALSQASWTDPAQLGYFAFFAPSATRDWDAFASRVRALFTAATPAQFGWFAESGSDVAATTLIQVASQGTPSAFVQSAFSLNFADNVSLVMQANPFPPQVGIVFDDGANTFQFANAKGIQLSARAPGQPTQQFASTSPNLLLPMNDAPASGGGSANAGSVNAAFQLGTVDLTAFEAGFMYFGPGQAGQLTALRYPAFTASAGAAMGFSGWFDVLGPLDSTRTYLQFTDPTLGSYFTTSRGGTLSLATTNGASATTSRLVFANRPVRQTGDTGTLYLTPAGTFRLAGDGGGERGNLLCGVTGTEFLDVGLGGGAPDALVLLPGQPAFQQLTPATGVGTDPVFLDSVGGNVTTSWVQLVTTEGSYVSQPQESPLYQQPSDAPARLADGAAESSLSVYLLDFLPLPTWRPATPGAARAAAPAAAPPVPMVPYAGLQLAMPGEADPFLSMESVALNPTRKNAFSAAQTQLNAAARAAGMLAALDAPAGDPVRWAMTPQGLLAGLDAQGTWTATQIAISPTLDGLGTDVLQITEMGEQVRQALQQNQTFLVVSTLTNPATQPQQLFQFAGADQTVNIAGWPFSLSPAGTQAPGNIPPILILKFYPGQSIADLVNDVSLWSQPFVFNDTFTPQQAQTYVKGVIQKACESVYGEGRCPDGTPSGAPDTSSLYYNFYRVVTDPAFSGVLALNANMQLNNLPTAIRAVTGGMTKPGSDGTPVSTIDQFRVHHVGVAINDTNPGAATPTLAQSSLFGLVDYEKPKPDDASGARAASAGLDVSYNFEVEYLRALFTNSELTSFACLIDLTINDLFGTPVALDSGASTAPAARMAGGDANVVAITGSYQAHSTSGDDATSGQGLYSFVAEGDFAFTFGANPYLDSITLTKLQFSFLQETAAPAGTNGGDTSTIQASFGIWGKMVFKQFDVLDIFSFQQLVFNDLGIAVQFNLTTYPATLPPAPPPRSPHTSDLKLAFSPGNLRLDLAATTPRPGSTSLVSLLPFKLTSFFYNQFPDQQSLEDLQYFSLASVPLGNGLSLTSRFNYALAFDLDLGSWGALAGPLQAFRFGFLIGWLTDTPADAGKIAFGIQLPEANGKLEITIQGVLQLVIKEFILKYQTGDDGRSMLVLALHNSFIQILGQRLPPGADQYFDFALFAPTDDTARIGWIAAVSTQAEEEDGGGGGADAVQAIPPGWGILPDGVTRLVPRPAGHAAGDTGAGYDAGAAGTPAPAPVDGGALPAGATAAVATREAPGAPVTVAVPPQGWAMLTDRVSGRTLHGRGGGHAPSARAADEGEKPVFQLVYLGLGQRTGPDPASPPTTFAEFLSFMQTDFWKAVSEGEYDKVYHPDGQWLALTDFKLLGIVEVGFVFYDVTPFYSLTLSVEKLFSFEITYTKVSDTIGLFYASFTLPDALRNFQVGAASLTLPSIAVSVYTNGDWKLDVGFPAGDDWSRSFRVQAQAGPVPVTGSGGFYIASLSSATSDVFKGSYPSIVAFGFAARLGVGKDFTAGPLKAGVSVTFFGIIQGAAGYLSSGATNIFQTPDALQLQGQFGIIGELYGSIDFVIIKASVNVRLQASIGIILTYERIIPDSGSILLYIEASVSVSVKVEIDLGFFSITISFSFRASFRFEWELLPAGSSSSRTLALHGLAPRRMAFAAVEVPVLPLLPGLTSNLALWFLPEGTVVFPAPTGTGTPWVAATLGIPYDPATLTAPPPYTAFKPFEAATAQLVTWAVGHALQLPGGDYTVTQDQVAALDQAPDALAGWMDYPTLLRQLAVFAQTTLTTPPQDQAGTGYASTFPMPPFLELRTTGRMNAAGSPDDLEYVFASRNVVHTDYIARVDAYFNQMFVNRQSAGADAPTALPIDPDDTLPLVQEIFLNYFTGLVRGGVHAVLQTMQDGGVESGRIDALIQAAVGAGQFQSLAGQMSSSFRGGVRLPYTDGLTVPGGPALTTTNPLFALLWQEFPVGSLGTEGSYTLALSNPDGEQTWLTSTATYTLTAAWLKPFADAVATDVRPPSAPVQLPFTDVGPQAFAFQNAMVWTQPGGATPTLFPFPGNLSALQAAGEVSVLVQSRATGAAYLPGGTSLPPAAFTWATRIALTAAQVPGADGTPLPDVFALSGASQADQRLIEKILAAGTGGIASLQLLYQAEAGASGLGSDAVDPNAVFVLRTNTTTVSAPPSGPEPMMRLAAEEPPPVPVGAALGDARGFLQIVQQAAVTNAPGYYLRYLNEAGKSLPAALFAGSPAPLTLLATWKPDGAGNTPQSPARVLPYYNTVVVQGVEPALLYYAETTDPALSTQYASVAPGSVGVLLTQSEGDALLQPHPRLAALSAGATANAAGRTASTRGWRRSELVQALVDAGVTDVDEVRAALADSGSGAGQLNALYSLVTYQVQATAGFVLGNLSAPVQPQQPDEASSAADGLVRAADDGGDTSSFRVYVPLYNVAARQSLPPRPPNRYASIGAPVDIRFYQNDAFGNQMPGQLPFASTNLYFDAIVPVDEWQGVVTAYDFTGGAQGTVNVYLRPDGTAFSGMSADEAAAALQAYYTIQDQLTAPGITLAVETNLARQGDGSMARVALSPTQTGHVLAMVQGIVTYLERFPAEPFAVAPVALAVAVSGPGVQPPVFELAVLLGIERDVSLVSPLLVRDGVVTFPAAQSRYSTVVPTVGSSLPGGGSVPVTDFAAAFVRSFGALVLSVGLGGATEAPQGSSAARQRAALRAAGVPGDGGGTGAAAPQSLWAVQASLVSIQIGKDTGTGPFYLSPTPLDNTLNTAVVPLPPLPAELAPPNWPATQLFTDVDLDRLNTAFFAAVDGFLSPASAAQAFELANADYTTVATGRRSLADLYSANEIDWLFDADTPFTGSDTGLKEGRTAFGEQMRAALATAYAVDTIVQYGVSWTSTLPPDVGDLYSLYGTVRPAGGAELPRGFTISASQVAVTPDDDSLLSFLFGVAEVQETASVTLDLEFDVTHVQHFLEPAGSVPGDRARPSIWLQLVNPYPPGGTPTLGTRATEIPLVFRQYPTPPTLVSQTGVQGPADANAPPASSNPLTAAAAWHLQYQYQAQLTVHDRLQSAVTYNTSLSAGSGGGGGAQNAFAAAETEVLYTLFQALARFSATWPVIMPVLGNLADPLWAQAAGVFAGLVTDVVRNTTWTPLPAFMLARSLPNVTDWYTITDVPLELGGERLITLLWKGQESSFAGATLAILAVSPGGVPYPDQVPGTVPSGITDRYVPAPPLVNDWVSHRVQVDGLNVLAAENALAGLQVERNVIRMASGPAEYQAKGEFIYRTPLVRATQPVTPFVDNDDPIDVAKLPNQGIGTGCPTTTEPPGIPGLCQRIYTLMYDLLADDAAEALLGAHALRGLDEAGVVRRVKVACGYQYAVRAAGGVVSANPVSPVVPVVLARSFEIDGSAAQLSEFSGLYATAMAAWASGNDVTLGPTAQADARFVFDVTLYAQISGLNTPVLRLRTLQLALTDIAV